MMLRSIHWMALAALIGAGFLSFAATRTSATPIDVADPTISLLPVSPGYSSCDMPGSQTLSQDGLLALVRCYSYNSSLFVYDVQTQTYTPIPNTEAGSHNYTGNSASLSSDGRYVAYTTSSSLLPGDTNTHRDIYRYDRSATSPGQSLQLISTASSGGGSYMPSIAANGQYVAFLSDNQTYTKTTVMLADATTGAVNLASPSVPLTATVSPYSYPLISGDGNSVIYEMAEDVYLFGTHQLRQYSRSSGADQLEVQDASGATLYSWAISSNNQFIAYGQPQPGNQDAFNITVRAASGATLQTLPFVGATSRFSDGALALQISDDGQTIAFTTQLKLLPADTNENTDVYVYNRGTNQLALISIDTDGSQLYADTTIALTSDGCHLLFGSPGLLYLKQLCTVPPPCPSSISPTKAGDQCPQKPWTVMVYLDGDNSLADDALKIFRTIEQIAPYNRDNINVAILFDLPGATGTNRYSFSGSGWRTETGGELKMNDPATLSEFVIWARSTLPAQHYALILSDHGDGLGGLMTDETSLADSRMTIHQLGDALRVATVDAQPIDVVYADTCLMGMIDDAYQIRGTALYYVASEAPIFTSSGRTMYFNIKDITAAMTPYEVAKLFAKNYSDRDKGPPISNPITISVADLGKVTDVANAAYALAKAISDSGTDLRQLRAEVQRFDQSDDGILTTSDHYVDLYHFAELINQKSDNADVKAKAQLVMNIVQQYVLPGDNYYRSGSTYVTRNGTKRLTTFNNQNAHGVSIFLPNQSSSFYNGDSYDFATGTIWQDAGPAPQSGSSSAAVETWGAMLVWDIHNTAPNEPDIPAPPLPQAPEMPIWQVLLPIATR